MKNARIIALFGRKIQLEARYSVEKRNLLGFAGGFLRGVPLGEGVGGKVRPKQVRMVVPCAEGQAPRLTFLLQKTHETYFYVAFWTIKG